MAEPKKKVPGLSGVLLGFGKKPEGGEDEGEESEEDMGELSDGEAAMSDLSAALDSGDMAAAWAAFENASRLCKASYSEDDESGE